MTNSPFPYAHPLVIFVVEPTWVEVQVAPSLSLASTTPVVPTMIHIPFPYAIEEVVPIAVVVDDVIIRFVAHPVTSEPELTLTSPASDIVFDPRAMS